MKLAKRPTGKLSLIRNLEKKAELHVKERYLGTSFLRRHESSVSIATIMVVSFIVSIPLTLILTELTFKILFLGSFSLSGLIAAVVILFFVVQKTVSDIRKTPDAPRSDRVISVLVAVFTFSFLTSLVLVLGSFIMLYALSVGKSLGMLFPVAVAIATPLTLGYAGARKLMTKKRLLPPELANTSFLERRKLRTTKGAIQRYLLDQINDAEKQSLESIDELLIKARLAVKRSREFVAKFRANVNQEKSGAPGYLKNSYDHAKAINQDCINALAKLEDYRATVVAYFAECKDRVNGISKMMRDRKLISDLNGFSKEVKSLPHEVDEQIAKTSQDILDSAKNLEKSLSEMRSEAEIDATIADPPDASMESLEKLEETISKCVDLEVPKDKDKDDEDLN